MQNVISDPVFGLPEKGFQKENVKDIPSGMLIWSISEGMFLKNEFQFEKSLIFLKNPISSYFLLNIW